MTEREQPAAWIPNMLPAEIDGHCHSVGFNGARVIAWAILSNASVAPVVELDGVLHFEHCCGAPQVRFL